MSRTYKSTGRIEIDEWDGSRYYQKPQCCSDKHSRNASKWARTNCIWPMDLRDFGMTIKRTNRTKDAWYEMCFQEAKDFEDHLSVSVERDIELMEAEWQAMQDREMFKILDEEIQKELLALVFGTTE